MKWLVKLEKENKTWLSQKFSVQICAEVCMEFMATYEDW